MSPVQVVSRFLLQRASGSYGELINSGAGGRSSATRKSHRRARFAGIKLLDPDASKDLNRRNLAKPRPLFLDINQLEQLESICANLFCQSIPILFFRWQTILLKAPCIPFIPWRRNLRLKPVGSDSRQHIESMAQRFADTFEPIEGHNGCQDMS